MRAGEAYNIRKPIPPFKYTTSSFAKKKPVDFDGELKTGNVRYDNMTKITIKVQLF